MLCTPFPKGYARSSMYLIVMSIANGKSSKIYHILSAADLLKYRVFIPGQDYSPTSASTVMDAILSFDAVKEKAFAARYYQSYSNMMLQVLNQLKK